MPRIMFAPHRLFYFIRAVPLRFLHTYIIPLCRLIFNSNVKLFLSFRWIFAFKFAAVRKQSYKQTALHGPVFKPGILAVPVYFALYQSAVGVVPVGERVARFGFAQELRDGGDECFAFFPIVGKRSRP